MALSPNGTKFATCSADKSVAVFDAKTGDLIKHYVGAHEMGIYDIQWGSETEFYTCSADNLVK
jgi:WD40 repeat protein